MSDEKENIVNDDQPQEVEQETTDTPNKPNIKTNYELDNDWSSPVDEWDDTAITATIPGGFEEDASRMLDEVDKDNIASSESVRELLRILVASLQNNIADDVLKPTVSDPESHWSNGVDVKGNKLSAGYPKVKEVHNAELVGDRALFVVSQQLGLGGAFTVPLYHSGIWVTLRPPVISEIIELFRLIDSDKIELGRSTHGLLFSNATVVITQRLIEFIIAHVHKTNVELPESKEQLYDLIKIQDIMSLIWGLACTMYPRGFQYQRPCLAGIDKCTFIARDKLNLNKLQMVDTKKLSDEQKLHMAARKPHSKTVEDVKRYQDTLVPIAGKRVPVTTSTGAELHINIASPSIGDYITSGNEWISSIIDMIESSITDVEPEVEEKNKFINQHANLNMLRLYGHWIESIEIGDNIIKDRDTVIKTLEMLGSDNQVRDTILDEINTYIAESTFVVIGVPSFECPQCGTKQSLVEEDDGSLLSTILPIDIINTFFEVGAQYLMKMAS